MTPKPPPSLLDRLRSFDPTVLPIIVAGLVLVGAVAWLLGRPLPAPAAPDARLQEQIATLRTDLGQRLAALEARTGPDLGPLRQELGAVAGRIAALEGRAAPDLAPLRQDLAAISGRIAALEGRAAPDLAPLQQNLATAAGRVAALEERVAANQREAAARPVLDPNAFAPRAAMEQATQRIEQLTARLDAALREGQGSTQQAQQRLSAMEQALGAINGRIAAAEAGLAARGQADEAQTARIGNVEQQAAARAAALEQALAGRVSANEQRIAQAAATLEQQQGRIATLEGTGQRLSALEGRSARMAALDAARAALDAGRPLGGAIGTLQNAPPALTRFATAAPPTEAALRLAFPDAARAALAASEPPAGGGVLDSAAARLSGLVTVRRGEQVLWGDAAAAEIERARRAVEAGDIEAALGHLQRIPPRAREAMSDWIAQAEALVAARAALRQMAAG
jgi:hypothetical protein